MMFCLTVIAFVGSLFDAYRAPRVPYQYDMATFSETCERSYILKYAKNIFEFHASNAKITGKKNPLKESLSLIFPGMHRETVLFDCK